MKPFATITSKLIPLPQRNVDTDQIIPARYLKVTDKAGLAEGLFHDWRYNPQGTENPDFVLNQPDYQTANILLVGDNFGCGSSREHAPWALIGWGIQAVISTSFADIFRNNALKNRLLPIVVDEEMLGSLFDLALEAPNAAVTIDLSTQTLSLPDGSTVEFPIDAFARQCLLEGVDQLGYIRSFEDQISAYEIEQGISIIR
ncbi:MAG: 3-isopropylmalate dehydratase small subunit [Anaerolineales bacterium]|nr:3-isopropylmalate dehydratase small subunit [Chloroflexota bacterium]MBL6980471.1 3-isopropylmalate dehydratase small subunit [Anaerolineales bacterium]